MIRNLQGGQYRRRCEPNIENKYENKKDEEDITSKVKDEEDITYKV